ncbi:MAG: hypothetical protein EOP87_04035 [Verrucomicrobiaceae bacterium]|nr:MAG: hypothetical protein EOP87_04035 [Verrucomicrobiaceae bacterium]
MIHDEARIPNKVVLHEPLGYHFLFSAPPDDGIVVIMRRRTFVFLVGTFALLTLAYLMWAALSCMRPVFIYSSAVPSDAKIAINKWRSTSVLLDQGPFLQGYLRSLMRPVEMKLSWDRGGNVCA